MTSKHDIKAAFLAYLGRQRAEQQQQLDLFSSRTVTMHSNGVDITAKTVEQIKGVIARLDALVVTLENEPDA